MFQAARSGGQAHGRLEYWTVGGRPLLGWFEATAFTQMQFSDDPAPAPVRGRVAPAGSIALAGAGRWNGRPGFTFEATATDAGGGRGSRDTFSLVVRNVAGRIVASVSGPLDGGNIQSQVRKMRRPSAVKIRR
jgi:hypothetical protein